MTVQFCSHDVIKKTVNFVHKTEEDNVSSSQLHVHEKPEPAVKTL